MEFAEREAGRIINETLFGLKSIKLRCEQSKVKEPICRDLEVQTLEGTYLRIAMTTEGYTLIQRNSEVLKNEPVYETIEVLLTKESSLFKQKWNQRLLEKLSNLNQG